LVRRSGRRPGNQDTRRDILETARTVFAERGFDKASIRAIAAGAAVDPALVHHYFGTKEKLFLECMNSPVDPAELVPAALAGPREQAGERLIALVLSVWDSPAGAAALGMFRSALSNEWTARLLREFVVTQVLRRAVAELALDPAEAPMRSALMATQVAGLLTARYVLRIEPLASAPAGLLVAALGPAVQRFLTEPLPGVFPTASAEPADRRATAEPADRKATAEPADPTATTGPADRGGAGPAGPGAAGPGGGKRAGRRAGGPADATAGGEPGDQVPGDRGPDPGPADRGPGDHAPAGERT
jgi:AcrR family transcriptional regulator